MPSPPQVTLELAQRLIDVRGQFQIVLVRYGRGPWSLFWNPNRPDQTHTHAGTRRTTLSLADGLKSARLRLNEGWDYAPWTLSEAEGVPGLLTDQRSLILKPLPEGVRGHPYTLVRRLTWVAFDHVVARDENDVVLCTLTELGARMLGGRLSVTPGLCQPRYEPWVSSRTGFHPAQVP